MKYDTLKEHPPAIFKGGISLIENLLNMKYDALKEHPPAPFKRGIRQSELHYNIFKEYYC